MRRSTKLLSVGLAAGIAATLGVSAQQVMAESQSLSGLKATTTLHASPYDVWFGQLTGPGICRLLPGCESAAKTEAGWVFTLHQNLPGVGPVTVDVTAQETRRVRPKRIRLALASDSTLGKVEADLTIRLAKRPHHRTKVTLRVKQARATGAAARVVMPLLRDNLQPNLRARADELDFARKQAHVRVRFGVRPRAHNKVTATVKVKVRSLALEKPQARGKVRVMAGSAVLCKAKVRASKGRCRFVSPPRGRVTGVVTGRYDNGYQVWNSGSRRWRP